MERRLETTACTFIFQRWSQNGVHEAATAYKEIPEGGKAREGARLLWTQMGEWLGASGSKCPVYAGVQELPGAPSMSYKHHMGGWSHTLQIPLPGFSPSLHPGSSFLHLTGIFPTASPRPLC